MARIALVAALIALLAASIYFAFSLWGSQETAAMPTDAYIAMAVGIFFSIVVALWRWCFIPAVTAMTRLRAVNAPSATADALRRRDPPRLAVA